MSSSFTKTNQRGLFYRASDRAYQMIVTAKGKQYRRVLFNHTERQALDKLRQWRDQLQAKAKVLTLNALYNEHKNLYAHTLTPHTLRGKEGSWQKWVSPSLGSRKIDNLNFKDYQKLVDYLLKNNLKPKSVKNIIGFISTLYNFAVRCGYTDHNPVSAVILPKFDNLRRFSLSKEFSRALFRSIYECPDPFWRAFWIFIAHGRRLNEVKSISWGDIDLKTGKYSIPCRINKAKRNMEYSATPFLLNSLFAIYPKNANTNSLVFPSPITNNKLNDVRRSWRRIKQDWANNLNIDIDDLPYMRIHDIRHLIGDFAVNELNMPIEKVSHALGHTSIAITEKYVNRRPQSSKEVIGAIFENNLGIRASDVSPSPAVLDTPPGQKIKGVKQTLKECQC